MASGSISSIIRLGWEENLNYMTIHSTFVILICHFSIGRRDMNSFHLMCHCQAFFVATFEWCLQQIKNAAVARFILKSGWFPIGNVWYQGLILIVYPKMWSKYQLHGACSNLNFLPKGNVVLQIVYVGILEVRPIYTEKYSSADLFSAEFVKKSESKIKLPCKVSQKTVDCLSSESTLNWRIRQSSIKLRHTTKLVWKART